MTAVPSLQILADNRNALLLAEASGWLHDYRKCSEEHLQTQAPGSRAQALARTELANKQPTLNGVNFVLLNISRNVANLLDDRTWNQDVLGQLLSRCHNTAHFDKQEPVDGEQAYPGVQISSPFGFEKPVGSGLTNNLWGLPWTHLASIESKRKELRESISKLFAQTVADSRRPMNEVDLWSWGMLVGALYKSSLAGALLTGATVPNAQNVRWRLLAVRFDGLKYLLNAIRIPDLLARQELLTDGLNRVQTLLEVTYPLGSEVYRDENGSVYVVPDVPNLPDCTDSSGTTLRTLILQEFSQGTVKNKSELRLGGEIVPHIELEATPWWGQDPGWPNSSNDELPNIGAFPTQPYVLTSDPNAIQSYWKEPVADICTVCGLRPQGPGQKALQRHVCDICEERRADRSQRWATSQPDTTIWNDEVADVNGRLALIAGQFGLDEWLSGEMVQTMLVKAEVNPNGCVPKNPSPARLRRVWETTQRFWQTGLEEKDAQGNPLIPQVQGRWHIRPQNSMPTGVDAYQTYDLLLNGRRLSVLWDGEKFITCDNLDYFEKTANEKLQNLLRPGATCELWTPASYGERTSKVAGVTIANAQPDNTPYRPVIPILAEPRTFMALVPAKQAMEVVKAIKRKYEQEMGKVRNRLPLTLGVVYFGRRTPLAAAIETGRRMLERPAATQVWEVHSKANCNPSAGGWPSAVCLTLQSGERRISLNIPTVMGNSATPDLWYPYWQVEGKPTDRTRWFIGPDGEHWVHVTDLHEGDRVGFMPSTFDFEYLDTTARRFEVIYDADGRRREATKRQRPYLLEEIESLEAIWAQLSARLATSQVKQIEASIESKRQAWKEPRSTSKVSPAFRQFVQDVLREAGIQSDVLEQAALRGMMSDALEIYMMIHKEKTGKELSQKEAK